MESIFPMMKIILSLKEHDRLYTKDRQHENILTWESKRFVF